MDLRQIILRSNAINLMTAATGGLVIDMAGSFLALGPAAPLADIAPNAGIGFVEAHGMALIFGGLLLQATPARPWHLAAAAVNLLFGVSNVMFWQVFVVSGMQSVGFATTAAHAFFAVLQLGAAASLEPRATTRSETA